MLILAFVFILIAIVIMASRVFIVILTLLPAAKGTENNLPRLIDKPYLKINITIRAIIGCGVAGFIIYSALAYFLSLHQTISIIISTICCFIPFVLFLSIIYIKSIQELITRNIKSTISQDMFLRYIGLDMLALSSLLVITGFIIIFLVYLSH